MRLLFKCLILLMIQSWQIKGETCEDIDSECDFMYEFCGNDAYVDANCMYTCGHCFDQSRCEFADRWDCIDWFEWDDTLCTTESDFKDSCLHICGWCDSDKLLGCDDVGKDCAKRKENNECLTDPNNMLRDCKGTCNMCFLDGTTTCRCSGDPHCTSFDGKLNHFQGKCTYTMMRDNCESGYPVGEPHFLLDAKYYDWSEERPAPSRVQTVFARFPDRGIEVEINGYDCDVLINGAPAKLPYSNQGIMVLNGNRRATVIDMVYGIEVKFRKGHALKTKVREEYQGQLCGICGDWNGNKNNDWTMGPKCHKLASPGVTVSDVNVFGHSWKTDDMDLSPKCVTTHCTEINPDPQPEGCTSLAQEAVARSKCNVINDIIENDKNFEECLSLAPLLEEELFADCEFDFCLTQSDETICNSLDNVAATCMEEYGLFINYQTPDFCPINCPNGMEHLYLCGECELNCEGELVDPTCTGDSNDCASACFCTNGMRRFSSTECMSLEQCAENLACDISELPDRKLLSSTAVVLNNCTSQSECQGDGSLVQSNFSCADQATCVSNRCFCAAGFIGDGITCKDINECKEGLSKCDDHHGRCVNTQGSFYCRCKNGYTGSGLPSDCHDVDECTVRVPCGNNSVCTNLVPGYSCDCLAGFSRNRDEECEDVNECETLWNNCNTDSTQCLNTPGSFTCECSDGFSPITGDSRACQDINECLTNLNICGDNADCENELGSYNCVCHAGYQMNKDELCEDINECEMVRGLCDPNAICSNTDGSFTCTCPDGFEGDGQICEVIRIGCEEALKSLCVENSNCAEDESGNYMCSCKPGFTGDADVLCDNIDECAYSIHKCSSNAECIDNVGSYSCTCLEGFEGDGIDCYDVNECLSALDSCDDRNAYCVNSFGSYICNCQSGFARDISGNCVDINECESADCGANAQCENLIGTYECRCQKGYSGGCGSCIDVNECMNGMASCHQHASCINFDGSFQCQCEDGFVGDGIKSCQPEDECELGLDTCGENSLCVNEASGYSCVCYPGYRKNAQRKCINVNECQRLVSGCSPYANCRDTVGSFVCECKNGYVGDGIRCTLSGSTCDNDVTCDFYADCVEGKCQCRAGFEGNGVADRGSPGCTDINECLKNDFDCDDDAKCINLAGSYTCKCKEGFTGSGKSCFLQPESGCNGVTCASQQECTVNDKNQPTCTCSEGFRVAEGIGCFDIDECELLNDNSCPAESKCKNLDGGYTCVCSQGLAYDKKRNLCVDQDECYLKEHLCSPYATCVNNRYNYTCKCNDGFSGDGFQCYREDNSDCKFNSCGSNSYCSRVNPETNTAVCLCQPGFKNFGSLTDLDCRDIDECLLGNKCSVSAKCINMDGFYKCECKKGFYGNGIMCVDIDECLDKDICGNTRCLNHIGTYECEDPVENPEDVGSCNCGEHGRCNLTNGACTCEAGFKEVNFLRYGKCKDFDECSTGVCKGDFERCVNKQGGFECTCLRGERVDGQCVVNVCEGVNCHPDAQCSADGDKAICTCNEGLIGNGFDCKKGENPCTTMQCMQNSICAVSGETGEAKCICNFGYQMIGNVCEDTDECAENPCGRNSNCVNGPGYHFCACKYGFRKKKRRGSCVDINECKLGIHNCDKNARCKNRRSTFACVCNEGFTGNGLHCTPDVDCKTSGPCDENAECRIGEEGKYVCICKDGFQGDGITCQDVDECANGATKCHSNAQCGNTVGSYTCQCTIGYTGNGILCDDLNECLIGDGPCGDGQKSRCVNNLGSYRCACARGYTLRDSVCTDINECGDAVVEHYCKPPATCTNTVGSYTCACESPGYTTKSFGCKDIDECADGSDTCDMDQSAHVQCQNTRGSFECVCQNGYELNANGKCVNVNECLASLHECNAEAKCIDTEGGYKCECGEGLEGNGFSCVSSDNEIKCSSIVCDTPGTKCVSVSGSEVCICKDGFREDKNGQCLPYACENGSPCLSKEDCSHDQNGNPVCSCKAGYDGKLCENVNECITSPGVCGFKGTCEDKEGSYFCSCSEGYEFNGISCANVDECMLRSTYCGLNTECTDTEGSYMCACKQGYVDKSVNGRLDCVNVDECEQAVCHEKATCVDLPGSYICTCNFGFRGNGKVCYDVNECAKVPPVCPARSECINVAGTFICQCVAGLKITDKGCEDINECLDKNRCPEGAECINQVGSYLCLCKRGYKTVAGACVDVNECKTGENTCHANAVCKNEDGGYTCSCKHGFLGDGHICSPSCQADTCPFSGQKCIVKSDGSAECVCTCQGELCLSDGPVCTKEFQEFPSYHAFYEWKCQSGKHSVQVDYRKACQSSCRTVVCEGWEECLMIDGTPTCSCLECTAEDLSSGPVCSSEMNTYTSLCALKSKACAEKSHLTISKIGPCVQDCMVGEWSIFSECSVSCGTGVVTRTREIIISPDNGGLVCPDLEDYEPCYKTLCENEACVGFECNRPGSFCELSLTGELTCSCPRGCMDHPEEPVCALMTGRSAQTFYNLCKLERVACLYDIPYVKLHDGKCTDHSADVSDCTLIPRFEIISDDTGCSQHVIMHSCKGTCGEMPEGCCLPRTKQNVDVNLVCEDGTNSTKTVEIINDCECADIPAEP